MTEANFVYTYPPTPGRDYSKGRSLIEQWSVKIPSSLSTHIHTGSMIEQNEEKEEEREKITEITLFCRHAVIYQRLSGSFKLNPFRLSTAPSGHRFHSAGVSQFQQYFISLHSVFFIKLILGCKEIKSLSSYVGLCGRLLMSLELN